MTETLVLWRRRVGLVSLVVASALLAAATAADPALGDVEWRAAVAESPGRALLHTTLLHWAWVLFVPGLLTLLGPVRTRGKVLAYLAWPSIIIGLVTFSGLILSDVNAVAVAGSVSEAEFARYDTALESSAWLNAGWRIPGLVGWALAMLLTPLAAARARVVPWWYAALAILGMTGYFLFAISPVPLSVAGPAVLFVANAFLAVRLWNVPGTPLRVGVAGLLVGPLSLLLGMATMPGGAWHIGSFASNAGAAQASAFFLHFGWLALVPGVLAVSARLNSWFGQIACGIAILGLISFSGMMIGDYTALAAEQIGAQPGEAPLFALGSMAFTLIGLVLVTVAAAREGLVRWPVPSLAGAGVIAFFMLTTGRVTGSVAPVLLLAAFAVLAQALWRAAPAEAG